MIRRRGGFGRILAAPAVLLAVIFSAGAFGCASHISTKISSPFGEEAQAGMDNRHVAQVLAKIEKRNREVENTPEWIQSSYREFMIKSLYSIDEDDYAKYSSFLDDGAVYIIVHPAYYTFFNDEDLFPDLSKRSSDRNALDSFLAESAYSSKSRLVRAQEKQIRDFLEYASTDKKLVILLLPRDYRNFSPYKFRGGRDEYMRFINEVTNGSDSVLYLYSSRPNRGTLGKKDMRMLVKFLIEIRAKEILLGGGYAGRCVEDFYKGIVQYYTDDKIFLVPEITAISPVDISSGAASDMLKEDGTIDVGKLSSGLQKNIIDTLSAAPRLKNLSPPSSGSSGP